MRASGGSNDMGRLRSPVPPSRQIRTLHGLLVGGLALLGGVLIAANHYLEEPIVSAPAFVGYVFPALALLTVIWVAAWFPRGIPVRRSGQGLDEYWAPPVRSLVVHVWMLVAGAGLLA